MLKPAGKLVVKNVPDRLPVYEMMGNEPPGKQTVSNWTTFKIVPPPSCRLPVMLSKSAATPPCPFDFIPMFKVLTFSVFCEIASVPMLSTPGSIFPKLVNWLKLMAAVPMSFPVFELLAVPAK